MPHEGLLTLFVLSVGRAVALWLRLSSSFLFSLMLAVGQFHEVGIDVENLFLEIADGAFGFIFDTKGAGFIEPVSRPIQYLFELVDLGEQRPTRFSPRGP